MTRSQLPRKARRRNARLKRRKRPADDSEEKKPEEKPAEDDPFSSVTPKEAPAVAKKPAAAGKGSIWGALTRAASRSVPSLPTAPANLRGPVGNVAPPQLEEPAMEDQTDPFADDKSEVKPASADEEVPADEEKPAAKPATKAEEEDAFDPFGDSK
ncbi:MAG: hypothetical protein U0894_11105 [Pirellulales bacterium]